MTTATDFDRDGITILNVFHTVVHVDYFGQGITIDVEPRFEVPPRGPYRRLRRKLIDAVQRFEAHSQVRRNREAVRQIRRELRHHLAPLLRTFADRGREPTHDRSGRVGLDSCVYKGVCAFELAQSAEHTPYLAEIASPAEPAAGGRPRHQIVLNRDLPTWTSDEVDIAVTAVSLTTVQGTVVLPHEDLEYTCLASRDVSVPGLRAAELTPTLSGLAAATALLTSLPRARRADLYVPRLMGYVYHEAVAARPGQSATYVVGGALLELVYRPRCWAALRRLDLRPPRDRQRRWATRIRDTLTLMHEYGMAWGGAVGVPEGGRGHRLVESVDIDGHRRPWLLRNFGPATSGQEAMQSDMAAVREMMAMAGDHRSV